MAHSIAGEIPFTWGEHVWVHFEKKEGLKEAMPVAATQYHNMFFR
jgi:hypothetical protein